MMTFSINTGSDVESTSYDLSNSVQFESILNSLKDNYEGLIQPSHIRNAIFSIASNIVFKETNITATSSLFIGIDTLNYDSDRDLKYKILVGKKAYSGTYSYVDSHDIFNSSLYLNNSDIFFYNTKLDSDYQITTKISILAGTSPSLFNNSPYISTQHIVASQSQSLNLVSDIGDINIISGSTVSINNIVLPILSIVSNDSFIVYSSGTPSWSVPFNDLGSYIGSTSSELDIYGEANVNGYSLEFTDSRYVPKRIGDIYIAESFYKYPINEILTRLLYPYQAPTGSIKLLSPYDNGYVEVGTRPSPKIEFTINKKTLPTITTALSNMSPNIYPPILSDEYKTITSNAIGVVPVAFTNSTRYYTMNVSDGTQSNSYSVSLTGVYPYFYGVGGLIKLVEGVGNKYLSLLGNGQIVFIYPVEYGLLSDILDDNNVSVIGTFSSSVINFSSPSGFWTKKPYYFYMSYNQFKFTTPTNYKFLL